MKLLKRAGIGLAAVVGFATTLPPSVHAEVDFGEVGEPVHLVVGYQPYYAESWSGVVNSAKQFWKKYLPEGSTVEFQVGLQGSVIVNAMTGEKQHVGYMGDMPAISSTFRDIPDRGRTDIRIVATLGTSKQQCNIFLVRNDAPEFADGVEAVKWLDGKTVSAPHGACTDRFARIAFEEAGVEPRRYLNQNIEVITTNFRARKLDAAAIWEPTASKIVEAGLARWAATGENFDALDGAFLVMLNDLIEQRPDVVKGWLQSELDAQLYMLDPANADEIIGMVEKQTEQIDRKVLWAALYGAVPREAGGGDVKVQFDFTITPRVRKLIDDGAAYLYSLPQKPAAAPEVRDEAVDDSIAREVLAERGLESPLGVIRARPLSDFSN